MRDWLLAARGCTCDTLDVCGLFEAERVTPSDKALPMVATACSCSP
jgi:hypothetical protein